jgi:uncharacterized protein YhfF
MKTQEFWQRFLKEKNLPSETLYFDCFHFELTEKWANELLRLVLIGQKKATASSLYAFEKENLKLPEAGDYSIVTNWDGEPKCVIETTKVTILPFKAMTFDLARLEGEDEHLDSWITGHRRFFTEEAKELGYEFTEEMPVVFEEFEVVYEEI